MPSIDRIPLHTIVWPTLGVAASLVACETSFGLLALALAVVLLGNVISAVLRTEVVAPGVGEPFGARVLALA